MDEALETRNETSRAAMRDQHEVQQDVVAKAHTVLVASTLIVALTYTDCLSSVEAAQFRKDLSDLKDFGVPPGIKEVSWYDFALLSRWAFFQALLTYTDCLSSVEAAQFRKDVFDLKDFGGPPGIKKVSWYDFALLSRWAFFLALLATILAAFAALPFSFANFLDDVVDDAKRKKLLFKTKVLIMTASYFLLFSLKALFFNFVCSQLISPHVDYQCALACEVALFVFCLCSFLFLVFNGVSY